MSLTQLSAADAKALGMTLGSKEMAVLVQVIRTSDANARSVHAHTLSRGNVRGGGKKPWKQKGTGRARVSSIRSPLWRGGGIIFGPKQNRNFKLHLPQSLRTKAVSIALASKANDGAIWVADNFPADGKTKSLATMIPDALVGKQTLVVIAEPTSAVTRAGRNIERLVVRQAAQVTTKELLAADAIIVTDASLAALKARTSRTKETA